MTMTPERHIRRHRQLAVEPPRFISRSSRLPSGVGGWVELSSLHRFLGIGPVVYQRRFFEIDWAKRTVTYFNEAREDGSFTFGQGPRKEIPMRDIVKLVYPSQQIEKTAERPSREPGFGPFDIVTPERIFTLIPIAPPRAFSEDAPSPRPPLSPSESRRLSQDDRAFGKAHRESRGGGGGAGGACWGPSHNGGGANDDWNADADSDDDGNDDADDAAYAEARRARGEGGLRQSWFAFCGSGPEPAPLRASTTRRPPPPPLLARAPPQGAHRGAPRPSLSTLGTSRFQTPTLTARDFEVSIVDSAFSPSSLRDAREVAHRVLLKREVNPDGGVPWEFECPLTLEVMVDPVVAADGNVYERAAIEEWLAKSGGKLGAITGFDGEGSDGGGEGGGESSGGSGRSGRDLTLVPHHRLKEEIAAYTKARAILDAHHQRSQLRRSQHQQQRQQQQKIQQQIEQERGGGSIGPATSPRREPRSAEAHGQATSPGSPRPSSCRHEGRGSTAGTNVDGDELRLGSSRACRGGDGSGVGSRPDASTEHLESAQYAGVGPSSETPGALPPPPNEDLGWLWRYILYTG